MIQEEVTSDCLMRVCPGAWNEREAQLLKKWLAGFRSAKRQRRRKVRAGAAISHPPGDTSTTSRYFSILLLITMQTFSSFPKPIGESLRVHVCILLTTCPRKTWSLDHDLTVSQDYDPATVDHVHFPIPAIRTPCNSVLFLKDPLLFKTWICDVKRPTREAFSY